MYRTLIIEDEIPIQKEIEFLLQPYTDRISLLGACSTVVKSLEKIQQEQPDLVFMDIQLEDGTAFDILQQLEEVSFMLIFITAYNQFAIRAIKAGAFDYLLKPLDEEEFHETLERLLQYSPEKTSRQRLEKLLPPQNSGALSLEDFIFISTMNFIQKISLKQMMYFAADGSYTHLHLDDGRVITASKPLKYFDDLIPEDHFIKIHQSYIVSKHCIEKMTRGLSQSVILTNGTELPVASRRKDEVMMKVFS